MSKDIRKILSRHRKKQGGSLINSKGQSAGANGKRGGYADGAKHGAAGGIKAKVGTAAKPIEFEGGEVVITAPAVEDNSKREFEGQMLTNREILSRINESGGGVSFAKGGAMPGKINCCGKEYKYGGKTLTDYQVVENVCGYKNEKRKKGGQMYKFWNTNYDIDKAYKLINSGETMFDIKEIDTYNAKHSAFDKNYSDNLDPDFSVAQGLMIKLPLGQDLLIDGTHRMANAYHKGFKKIRVYYIDDPKTIKKFSKKDSFFLNYKTHKKGGPMPEKVKNKSYTERDAQIIGVKTKRALRTNASYEILDNDSELNGSTWTAGACYPLAKALHKIYGGKIVFITNPKGEAQHVLLKIGGGYIDGDGYGTAEKKLKIQRQEGVKNPVFSESYDKETSSIGIGTEETVNKIVDFLRKENFAEGGPVSPLEASKSEAEKYLASASRTELIDLLKKNDPNGVYTDKDSIQEFGKPATLEALKESFWRSWDGAASFAEGGQLNHNDIKTDLARNNELNQRAREYRLLPAVAEFDAGGILASQSFAAGGSITEDKYGLLKLKDWELNNKMKILQGEKKIGNFDNTTNELMFAIMAEINKRQGESLKGLSFAAGGTFNQVLSLEEFIKKYRLHQSTNHPHEKWKLTVFSKGSPGTHTFYSLKEKPADAWEDIYEAYKIWFKKGASYAAGGRIKRKPVSSRFLDHAHKSFAKGGQLHKYTKGEKFTVNINGDNEVVEILSNIKAGISATKFISLKRKSGAPFTVSITKFEKSIADKNTFAKGGPTMKELIAANKDRIIIGRPAATSVDQPYPFRDFYIVPLGKDGIPAEVQTREGKKVYSATDVKSAEDWVTSQFYLEALTVIRDFIPQSELDGLMRLYRSEERDGAVEIAERLKEAIEKMPKTYGTEKQKTDDKIIYLHYFYGGSDWYLVEKDSEKEQHQAFGYAILNGDHDMAEWGYISIEELKSIKSDGKYKMNLVELDFHFNPIRFGDLKKKWMPEEETKPNLPSLKSKEQLEKIKDIPDKSIKSYLNEIDWKIYQSNEQDNSRSENALLLAQNTNPYRLDLVQAAETLIEEHNKIGHLTNSLKALQDHLYAIIKIVHENEISVIATANYKNAYELNKAIEKLLDSRPGDMDFTSEEKDFIRHYSGYGGLDKYGATGKGILYEYFTPTPIAEKMWGLAYKFGFKGGHVLEPSVGTGEFLKFAPVLSQVDAYEINKYSARICKILYPAANVQLKSFEENFIVANNTIKGKVNSLKKYDLVIGNPPYGSFEGKWAGMGEDKYTRASNYIDYFIFRGLDLLKPGGLLIYIIGAAIGNTFLGQQNSVCKKEIIEKSDLLDAYRLPNGVFERTDVLTDIIVLRKK